MLRSLLATIVLAPAGSDDVATDAWGNPAGILNVTAGSDKLARNAKSPAFGGAIGMLDLCVLVAGTGFEPVTFRL